MEETTQPTIEELAKRITALELRTAKLDRLIYKLFEEIKRLILNQAMTGTSNELAPSGCQSPNGD